MCRELICDDDNSYRIHAASHAGRLVTVKTFEGPRAKQVSTFLCLLLTRRYNKIGNPLGLESERSLFKEMPVSSFSSLQLFDSCFMTESKSSHPNVLQIVGVSDERSNSYFIQFRGSK